MVPTSSKLRIWGGDGGKGYSTQGDILVNATADGVDLQDIWAEVRDAVEVYNKERATIGSLLSYPTVAAADVVPQSLTTESFEEATEFGIPKATRPPADTLKLGYTFKDFDLSLRSTWKFLRDATAEQVQAGVTRVFEADNKNVNGTILRRLFNPAVAYNEWNHRAFGLWSNDGQLPPPYLGKTFDSAHTHYLTSGSTTLDSEDVEVMLRHVTEHGYGTSPGSQMVIFAHPDDVMAATMTAWRAGVEYRTGGPLPLHDFIPSALMPAWISTETIHGPIPKADYNGLQVWGSYAGALLIQSNYVPKGWAAVVASGGPDSDMNPVGFRQHVNPAYQGLRHIPGAGPYPLIDSFFARGFGVGVRHRSAAVVMQITASGTYAAPAIAT